MVKPSHYFKLSKNKYKKKKKKRGIIIYMRQKYSFTSMPISLNILIGEIYRHIYNIL